MKEATGSRLKKLRLERGISLEEVQKKTRIHLNILKAIEEDNLVSLNPVYIKGFLKIYCKFLNVDPREFILDYKEPKVLSKSKEEREAPPKTGGLFKNGSFRLGSDGVSKKIKGIFLILMVLVFIWVLFKLGQGLAGKVHFPVRKRTNASVGATSSLRRQERSETPKTQEIPLSKNIRLGILSREDCLIQLKCDGHTLFKGILRRGRSASWQAKERMELSLGNAGVVELEVNGKRITGLGKRGKPLRNIVITREGLSVGK